MALEFAAFLILMYFNTFHIFSYKLSQCTSIYLGKYIGIPLFAESEEATLLVDKESIIRIH